MTVVVIIAPGATGRIATVIDNAPGRNFRKSPIPIVMIEKIVQAARIGHKQIHIAIPVIISPRHAVRIPGISHDIARCDRNEVLSEKRGSEAEREQKYDGILATK